MKHWLLAAVLICFGSSAHAIRVSPGEAQGGPISQSTITATGVGYSIQATNGNIYAKYGVVAATVNVTGTGGVTLAEGAYVTFGNGEGLKFGTGNVKIEGTEAASTINLTIGGAEVYRQNASGRQMVTRTKAQIDAITPGAAGMEVICSNCAVPYDLCIATGTTISGFRATINSAINTAVPGTLVPKGCGTDN